MRFFINCLNRSFHSAPGANFSLLQPSFYRSSHSFSIFYFRCSSFYFQFSSFAFRCSSFEFQCSYFVFDIRFSILDLSNIYRRSSNIFRKSFENPSETYRTYIEHLSTNSRDECLHTRFFHRCPITFSKRIHSSNQEVISKEEVTST